MNIGQGDCACLATAIVTGLPVWTADRDWKKFDVPIEINLIR
jgi:PIN domain nuclease of toxin-antitoxin system